MSTVGRRPFAAVARARLALLGRAGRGAPGRCAVRRRSVTRRITAHLRPDRRHRRARLQPAARLHGAALVRPLRLLRRRRLHGGVHGQVPEDRIDGALPRRGHPRNAILSLALRLRLRALHEDLLRHPDAGAVAGAVEPGLQVLLGDRRHRRPARADADAGRGS